MAMNCCVKPLAMLGFGGVTWIDTRLAEVTVSVAAGDTTRPEEAVMLVDPTARVVPKPFEPRALLTVATVEFDDDHVTIEVRFCVELSVYTPVAVNCWVRPFARLGLGGVTWIAVRVAAVTVRVALGEVTLPSVALMLAEPTPVADARPPEPGVLLTLAMLESDDDQVTVEVRSCVDLSV